MQKRRFLGGVLLAAIVGAFGFAATASAVDYPEPQTTNIPYVGWLGSQLRLSKCVPLKTDELDKVEARANVVVSDNNFAPVPVPLLRGNFAIEAWTGSNQSVVDSPFFNNGVPARTQVEVVPYLERYTGPPVRNPNVANPNAVNRVLAGDEGVRLCFSTHLISPSPGLAVIKLSMRWDLLGFTPGADPREKHQFLAIFLQANTPVIDEAQTLNGLNLPVGDLTTKNVFNPGEFDASHPGNEWGKGLVVAKVTGSFPHGVTGSPLLPDGAATYTLPNDWAALAALWATDDDAYNGGVYGSAPNRWDIHDDTTIPAEQHTSDACATAGATFDVVDNCLGTIGDEDRDLGPFSRDNTQHDFVNREVAYPAIGPFDPLRPNTTFLPDGKLNSGDAPMPAFRVDFNLAQGSIGSFEKADKTVIYSKNVLGSGTAHNLYAPFYKAYIPAAPGPTGGRSGVAGAEGNNYPGFVNSGVYDFWSLLLEETYTNPANTCRDPLGRIYPSPSGVSGATTYTDEHGEAWIVWNPVTGDPALGNFFQSPFLGFVQADGTNRKCDVRPGLAGTANISALGKYPDQPGPSLASNAIVKTVNHLGSKTLTAVEKVGFDGIIVTEEIRDLAGNPIPGAKVRITVESEVGGGAQNIQGEGQVGVPYGSNGIVLTTGSNGQAKAYITSSFNRCLDIRAENLGTQWLPARGSGPGDDSSVGVTRTIKVTGLTAVACGGTGSTGGTGGTGGTGSTGSAGSAGSGGSSGGSSAAGSAATVSLGGPIVQAPALQVTTSPQIIASNAAKLMSVKVLQTKTGRFLIVSVKGSAKTAKLRFSFVNSNGKVFKTVVRTVKTNKAIKVSNLKLPGAAMSVKAVVTA